MNVSHLLGWTLIDSIWEVAAIAAVLFVVLLALRRKGPQARYFAALAALTIAVTAPIATCARLVASDRAATLWSRVAAGRQAAHNQTSEETAFTTVDDHRPSPSVASLPSTAAAVPSRATSKDLREHIEPLLPKLVELWLVGLILMCVRMAGGLFGVLRLRRSAQATAEPRWQGVADSLAARLRIRRQIPILRSALIEAPAVIGFVKTVILLPTAALSRLTSDQIEALIAHELAHIRRYDPIVNFIQAAVEAVLFYHPALWWISSVVRSERENCCDDLAIQEIGDREVYARALVGLEELRVAPRLAVAANGGSLAARIRRIVKSPELRYPPTSTWAALVIVLSMSIGAASALRSHGRPNQDLTPNTKGVVLTAEGRPAAGATVLVETFDDQRMNLKIQKAVAGQDGAFEFQYDNSRGYFAIYARLKAKAAGVVSNALSRRSRKFVPPSIAAPPVVIHLSPTAPVGVRVLDSHGAPMAGIRVGPGGILQQGFYFLPAPEFAADLDAVTDASGRAVIDSMPIGTSTSLQIDDSRYVIDRYEQAHAYPREGGWTVSVKPACVIEGLVTLDGRPMPETRMHWFSGTFGAGVVTSDSEGKFKLDRVPPGHVNFRTFDGDASSAGYIVPRTQVLAGPSGSKFVEVKLLKGTLLNVSVRTPAGAPVADAGIQIEGPDAYRMMGTDDKGAGQIRLIPGTYKAWVYVAAWRDGINQTVVVRDTPRQDVDLVAASNPELEAVRVKVVDADGHPGVTRVLNLDGWSHKSSLIEMTDMNGDCVFMVDKSELPRVSFQAQIGDQFSDHSVKPINGFALIKLHRVRLGGIQGRIVNEAGKPVAGAGIRINDRQWFQFVMDNELTSGGQATGADGRYRFVGLYPGLQRSFEVGAPGYADTITSQFHVVAGEPRTFPTIVLKRAATLSGRVVDQHGKPVANAYVIPDDPVVKLRFEPHADANGNFRIENLNPGTYRVGFYKGSKEIHVPVKTGTNGVYTLRL